MGRDKKNEKRPGRHSIPRWLLQAHELTTDQRWLLIYFASYDKKWEFHEENIVLDIGWGRAKYYKNAKVLEDAGYIERKKIRRFDKQLKKRVIVGVRVRASYIGLSVENQQSENPSKCRKSASSKSTQQISPSSIKGQRSDFDVIDCGDVVAHPDDSEHNNG